jgi:endonuclease/exonuclease/phosphatase family metal-dependent hydrolase
MRYVRSSRPPRLLRLTVVVVALLAAATVQAPAEAQVEPQPESRPLQQETFWIHQFNVCSPHCEDENDLDREPWLNLVVDYIRADEPWYVSLNEVCIGSHVSNLVAASEEVGWPMEPAWVVTSYFRGCPGEDKRFGNLLLYRYPAAADARDGYFDAPENDDCDEGPDQAEENECRGWVCQTTDTPVGQLNACSAHLESSDTEIAQAQAVEYLDNSLGTGSERTYLIGDFNLVPENIPAVIRDTCGIDTTTQHPTYNALEEPEAKIDYIWICVGSSLGEPARPPNCFDDLPARERYSDHCYLFLQETTLG